jgi:hypothetical protein
MRTAYRVHVACVIAYCIEWSVSVHAQDAVNSVLVARGAPPVPVEAVFPRSQKAMAATLTDPHIALETKVQLLELIELRKWPQELEDRYGNLWQYAPGKPPRIVRSGLERAKELLTKRVWGANTDPGSIRKAWH